MTLAVIGHESLAELESMVRRHFDGVVGWEGARPPVFPGDPFGASYSEGRGGLGKRLRVVPVRDVHSLSVWFPMRETDTLYYCKPTRYLSHLVGHEAKGSILALLKKRGLANELSAGESVFCLDFACFAVTVELTETGLARMDDVVRIVFAYFNMLRNRGIRRGILCGVVSGRNGPATTILT